MNRQTVVLVNPPNKRIVLRDMYSSTIAKGAYNWPCVDLLVISGVLRDSCDVHLMDANTLGLGRDETVEAIVSLRPAAVCFSFGISVRDEEYVFVRRLRERLPGAKIIGTGGLLYHDPENELRSHPEFDACLLNFVTPDIVRYLSGDTARVRNMVFKEKGAIIRAPVAYPDNGFSYPIPLHRQLPLQKYCLSNGRERPLTSVLASFGCPGRCRFCVSGTIEYRYRDPANVLEELLEAKAIGIREIVFRDNVFCARKSEGIRLMEMMLEKRLGMSWVAETWANSLDEETAALMKRSGCHSLHIGVESASPETLARYKKGTDCGRIRQSFRLCRKHGIRTVGYFMMGLPGETKEDMFRTIDLAIELDCDYASFNVCMPVIGTALRAEAEQNGWLGYGDTSGYDGSYRSLIATPEFSGSDVSAVVRKAYRRFYFRPRYALKALRRCTNAYQARALARDFVNLLCGHAYG